MISALPQASPGQGPSPRAAATQEVLVCAARTVALHNLQPLARWGQLGPRGRRIADQRANRHALGAEGLHDAPPRATCRACDQHLAERREPRVRGCAGAACVGGRVATAGGRGAGHKQLAPPRHETAAACVGGRGAVGSAA